MRSLSCNQIWFISSEKRNFLIFQRTWFKLFFGIIIVFVVIYPVHATEGMFRANPQHTGQYDNVEITLGNTELWCFSTGSIIETSPAIVNGAIFIGGSPTLYALNANTGKEKWEFTTDGEISSPAVANGIVYAGSMDNNLYALDAETGKELWRFITGNNITTSPAILKGVIYFVSNDHNLYALDAETGKELWFSANHSPISPAISNGIIYTFSSDENWTNYLDALDATTGEEKWQAPIGSFGFPSSPVVSNGIVYISFPGLGKVLAINATTGKEKWELSEHSWDPTLPAVSNGLIFVGSIAHSSRSVDGNNNPIPYDKYLYAFDPTTGNMKWRFTGGGFMQSSPVVSNGVVYSGSDDGNLYALDAATGKENWHYSLGGIVTTDPVLSNGIIYVGNDNGNFIAIGNSKSPSMTTPTMASTLQVQNTISLIPSLETDNTVSTISTRETQNLISPAAPSNNRTSVVLILLVLLLGTVLVSWMNQEWLKNHSVFLSKIISKIEKWDWKYLLTILCSIFIIISLTIIFGVLLYHSDSVLPIIIGGMACIIGALNILFALKTREK